MKMTLQVIIEDEDHDTPPIFKEVFSEEGESAAESRTGAMESLL